jgi:putative transcriptional regulator
MSERDIRLELVEGIKEIKSYKAGNVSLKTRQLKEPASPQVIRKRLNFLLRQSPGRE